MHHKVSIFSPPQIPLKQTPITLLTISLKILENDVHLVCNFPNNFTLQKYEGELNQRLLEQNLHIKAMLKKSKDKIQKFTPNSN